MSSNRQEHLLTEATGISSETFPNCGAVFPHSRQYDELTFSCSTIRQLRDDYLHSRSRELNANLPRRPEEREVGMSRQKCLVVSDERDDHADMVIERLRDCGQDVFRWHPFSSMHSMECNAYEGLRLFDGLGRSILANEAGVVWWRSPRPPDHSISNDHAIDLKERHACVDALPTYATGRWISEPCHVLNADLKLVQLQTAIMCGFSVPEFLVSSRTDAIADFLRRYEQVVIKPINEGSKRINISGVTHLHLVRAFREGDLLELVRAHQRGPAYVQAYVDKEFDVRVTAVGQDIYAYRIGAGGTPPAVDWRTEGYRHGNLEFLPIHLPTEVEALIRKYLTTLRIDSGSFDFSVTASGDWYFLECNANGQWAWLEFETGDAISTSFSSLLLEHLRAITSTEGSSPGATCK